MVLNRNHLSGTGGTAFTNIKPKSNTDGFAAGSEFPQDHCCGGTAESLRTRNGFQQAFIMSAAAHSASGGPSGGNVASPVSPASEPVDIYLKAKAILSASQGAVDALSSFMAARAQLEDTYSKALTKLAKSSLNVDEASLYPAVFEAIASLRGDVANEARQHAEMHFSINKDVLEPLGSLKETADMVVRVVSYM